MEIIIQKAIELLLNIISKEDYEIILYEKVKTEDLVKNKLLFEFVNINYRNDSYKNQLLEVLDTFLDKKAFMIYKVNLYSSNIINESDTNIIYKNFNKIYDLFEFDVDYNLMWDFYNINVRIDLVGIKYEDESDVLKSLKELCSRVCSEFDKLLTIREKALFLVEGFKQEIIVIKSEEVLLKNKFLTLKKWYEFWK